MPLGRRHERREERRQDRRGEGRVHFKMRQRLVSIGDDFWIETDGGERAYKVDGKALRLRKTLVFEDAEGHELAKIQERLARVKDSMEVEDPEGNRLAMVKKALVSPVRDRWSVQISDGPDLDIQGNVVDHEYTFTDGRTPVATVSKKWFRVADTYGVEIEPDQDPVTILAATVAIDMMAHESR
ncbi:MAG TPA: LURP-one-related family protein [Nocardioidaceae bacterium]